MRGEFEEHLVLRLLRRWRGDLPGGGGREMPRSGSVSLCRSAISVLSRPALVGAAASELHIVASAIRAAGSSGTVRGRSVAR